ncbi:MAG TPA: gluconokinase, partial [Ktedonobacterales bacterium]|nr:gluconokinase [Ktedonobacterales bacterium]
DIGTSSVRAMLFDARGDAVQDVHIQRSYPLTTTAAGEVTVDADMLAGVVCEAIDAALRAAGDRAGQIAGVATDTFWHSLIAVDASGRPLTPVITWADTRARDASAALRQQFDTAAIHLRTGAPLHTSYWPARMRWFADTRPDILTSAANFLSFGEYLHRRVLGRSVCSLCMASATGLFATQARTWDLDLARALGVRPEQLPALGDLRDALHGLTPDFALRWPALRDTPWFPAIGDGAAANVGSGCAGDGRVALTVGTSSAVRVLTPARGVVPPDGLWLYLLDASRAVLGGALSEGGNVLAWLERTLRIEDLASAEKEAASLAPDGHGLTILPFIAGERSLGWHGEARGTIAGVSVHTTPADVLRAALEALAYRITAVYERLEDSLKSQPAVTQTGAARDQRTAGVVGSGGALLGSPLFQQIVADTLGAPLSPSRDSEASARGAALLALEALGLIGNVADVAPRLAAAIQPDPARTPLYRAAMRRQEDLYRRLLG